MGHRPTCALLKGCSPKCFRHCQVALQNICTTSHTHTPTPYAVASVSTCSIDDQWKKILPAVLSEALRTQATVHMFFSNDTAASQPARWCPGKLSKNAFPSSVFAFSNPSRWAAVPLLRCSCLSLCLEASVHSRFTQLHLPPFVQRH